MYTFYKFKTRGIGLISTQFIKKDTYLGDYYSKEISSSPTTRHVFDGWIETDPLGRYLNHSINCNTYLLPDTYRVKIYSLTDIQVNTEVTVNYLKVGESINLPDDFRRRYKIFEYPYVEEEIILDKYTI